MTVSKLLGCAMISFVLLFIFTVTAILMGLLEAIALWSVAVLFAGFIFVGVFLALGGYDE